MRSPRTRLAAPAMLLPALSLLLVACQPQATQAPTTPAAAAPAAPAPERPSRDDGRGNRNDRNERRRDGRGEGRGDGPQGNRNPQQKQRGQQGKGGGGNAQPQKQERQQQPKSAQPGQAGQPAGNRQQQPKQDRQLQQQKPQRQAGDSSESAKAASAQAPQRQRGEDGAARPAATPADVTAETLLVDRACAATHLAPLVTALADAAHEVGALMVLDCIASGAVWVDMAATGVDVLISAPQKGWSASPAAGLVRLSERGAERLAQTESNSFALDLKKWRAIMATYEDGGHAYHATMPTDALVASVTRRRARSIASTRTSARTLSPGRTGPRNRSVWLR